jgi:hypothetical protein
MRKGNRTKKVNMVVNPEIWFPFYDKCKEQGITASASLEIWMKSVLDSESAMRGFENIFSVLVDAEVKKRLGQ